MPLQLFTDESKRQTHIGERPGWTSINAELTVDLATIAHLRATTDIPTVDELPSTSTSQVASSRL